MIIKFVYKLVTAPVKSNIVKNSKFFSTSQCIFAQPSMQPGGKKAFVRDRPHMNVGTIGHVDHGKTTLTAAITKVLSETNQSIFKKYEEIDKAPEEKRRGITINAAIVDYSTKNRHYAHTDCPGHADYVKNMITGTNQMEAAILVVAGTEGSMPQTREHLVLARQIGIQNLVVFINKADAADSEMIELVELEIRELLSHYGFDGDKTPVVVGSALCALEGRNDEIGAKKILELLEKIDEIPLPPREADKPLFLPIESVMSITGRGTVATGRVERGIISPGLGVEILGYNATIKTTITGIEMFHQLLDKAVPGDQVGVLLRGVKKEELRRGMIITTPKSAQIANYCEAQIYMLAESEGGRAKPIAASYQTQIFSKSWDCPGFLMFPEGKDLIMPGEDSTVKLHLLKKMVLEVGQRFTMRSGITLGYGVVSKLLPDPGPGKWEKN